jgi:hypothetical protein
VESNPKVSGSQKKEEEMTKKKEPKLGTGERFRDKVAKGMSPALVAHIGRKKYGKKKMAEMAAAGRRRAAAKRMKDKKK